MSKLTGFNKVAIVNQGGRDYFFALYDEDDIKSGDMVLVSGDYMPKTVDNVCNVSDADIKKTITAEIICKVDYSNYNNRVAKRKEAERLKKEMDKRIKLIEEENRYTMFAEKDPELAKMLEQYNELV